MQERVGNVRRKMEILRKNQKEMLKIKKKKKHNTVTVMKNAFDRLLGKLDTLRKDSLSLRI